MSRARRRSGPLPGKPASPSGPDLTVSTTVDFAVKVLDLTAYRYNHRRQELWKGDAFQSASTQTDDNGTRYTVHAQRTAGGIDVGPRGHAGRRAADLPLERLADRPDHASQHPERRAGAPPGHASRPREGEDGTGWIDANHYRYSGDVTKDQWFDDRGRWVKTTFKASDGSTIEYILQA